MRFLSLFSGIDAASVAWKPLGWECVGFSEIDDFPCEVLKYHYPNIPNLGDISKITKDGIIKLGQIDLIIFGSPCQDLSTAGKKLGFEGERSGLFNTAIKIIEWAKKYNGCRFALWENVTGAFSSNKGRDFAIVVEKMAGCRGIEPPNTVGAMKASRWEIKECLNGLFWTRNGLEYRKDGDVSTLSQILETGMIDPQFYLSQTDCEKLLARATLRQRTLPLLFQQALMKQIE